jgi:hypothetical protein
MLRFLRTGTLTDIYADKWSDGIAARDNENPIRARRLWKSIQLSAVTVLVLSRRDEEQNERLWYLPASRFEELQTLAPPGSEESKAKATFVPGSAFRKFGNPSITVSWKALAAIETATGTRPIEAREVIRDIAEFQSPAGAYGSKIVRKDQNFSINENARHTAMALLVQMLFGADQGPVSIFSRFERLVRWMVSETVFLPGGGWSFEQSEVSKRQGLGATSTIACLMALCQFVKMCNRDQLEESGLFALIQDKVALSLQALVRARTSGIWDLRNEGLPLETRTAESAYVISGVRYAIRFGALAELTSGLIDAEKALRELQMDLVAVALPLGHGWPADVGGLSVSPAATICSLHALLGFPVQQLPAEQRSLINAAEERMLTDIRRDNGWEFLRTWDWATLAEISTAKIGPLARPEWNELLKSIAAVREAKSNGRLSKSVLRHLPVESRLPLRYCLTRGGAISLHDNLLANITSSSTEFIKRSSWGAWTAVISFFVGLLLAKYIGLK